MVTLHEVITFLVSMQISISSLQTHNVNRCGRSRHLARKLSLRRKRSKIGRAVQQECRDRARMPSSARKKNVHRERLDNMGLKLEKLLTEFVGVNATHCRLAS